MQLLWTLAADEVMTRLECDPTMAGILAAVRRALGRLELDPYERRLGTRQFSTELYGQMRSTPAGVGDWRVIWQVGPGAHEITIVFISETSP